MIRGGLIGYGYWGPNLVRNFVEAPGIQVACIGDRRSERRNTRAALTGRANRSSDLTVEIESK